MADERIRLPHGSCRVAALPEKPVKPLTGLSGEPAPVGRMRRVVFSQNEVRREIFQDGRRDGCVSRHVNQAPLEELRLAATNPKIRLMVLRTEVNRRIEVHMDVFKVHIGVGFESMFSSYKAPTIRRIGVWE